MRKSDESTVANGRDPIRRSKHGLERYIAKRRARSEKLIGQIRPYLPEFEGAQCLDVGCGHGTLSQVLSEEGYEVVGIDKDPTNIRIAKEEARGTGITFLVVDVEEYDIPDGSFELVVLFDVLEHVADPTNTLRKCVALLRRGGTMIVEYTPYWSLVGHHLYDFTLLPAQIIPRSWTRWLVERKQHRGVLKPEEALEQFRQLNRMSTWGIWRILRRFPQLRLLRERRLFRVPGRLEIDVGRWPFLWGLTEPFNFSHFLAMRKVSDGH